MRRRYLGHAAVAAVSGLLAVAATGAVRFELEHGPGAGATGVVIALLEFVFITAIIPLVVTTLYYGASAVSEYRRLRRLSLPEARLRL